MYWMAIIDRKTGYLLENLTQIEQYQYTTFSNLESSIHFSTSPWTSSADIRMNHRLV
jgi:hypothetical protein